MEYGVDGMMVRTEKLDNGINVIMERIPYVKSVSIGVFIKVGSAYETKDTNGLSHVIEHMLFKRTSSRSSKDIADAIASLGGNLDAFTSKDCTCFYARTLQEHIYTAIDIISDMIQHSVIDGIDLKKELGVILDEMDMYEDSPEDMVHEHLQREVWKDHPLGYIISGEKSVVSSFTRDQILDFMRTHYVAEKMYISLAGNFDEKEMLSFLNRAFGRIKSGGKQIPLSTPEYKPCFYLKERDIEQSHVILAYESIPVMHKDRYILTVVNSIIGGNVNSRLFQVVREELGLAYAIYSYGSSFEKAGLFQIYGATGSEQILELIQAVLKTIDDMKEHGITEKELAITKELIKTELIIGSESTQGRMNNNAKSMINYGKVMCLDTIIDQINQVCLKDIKEFMNQYFDHRRASVSIVGDIANIDTCRIREMLDK